MTDIPSYSSGEYLSFLNSSIVAGLLMLSNFTMCLCFFMLTAATLAAPCKDQ